MLPALLWLFNTVVILYILALIAFVLMSWLTTYKVIDGHNPPIERFDRALAALTDPALKPVRRVIPAIGGLDFSAVVVILLLEFLRRLVDALLSTPVGPGGSG